MIFDRNGDGVGVGSLIMDVGTGFIASVDEIGFIGSSSVWVRVTGLALESGTDIGRDAVGRRVVLCHVDDGTMRDYEVLR